MLKASDIYVFRGSGRFALVTGQTDRSRMVLVEEPTRIDWQHFSVEDFKRQFQKTNSSVGLILDFFEKSQLPKTAEAQTTLRNILKEALMPTKKELPLATAKIVKAAKGQELPKTAPLLERVMAADSPVQKAVAKAKAVADGKVQPSKEAPKKAAKVEAPPVKALSPKEMKAKLYGGKAAIVEPKAKPKRVPKVVEPPKEQWHKVPVVEKPVKAAPVASKTKTVVKVSCPAAVLALLTKHPKKVYTTLGVQEVLGEDHTFDQIRQALFQLDRSKKIKRGAGRGEFTAI